MKFMRIVSMGCGVNIQESDSRRGDFKQRHLSYSEFYEYMRTNFKKAFADYLVQEEPSASRYFYHYKETPEMIRSGEAYVFERGVD